MDFRLYDARTALRDREIRYRSLFENSGDQVWIEDFSAFKTRVDELRAFLGPDAPLFFGEELAVLAEGGLSFETEILPPDPAGEPGLFLLSVNVLEGHQARLDRVHVFIHDLGGVRRLEAALEKKDRLQRLLVELATTFIDLPPQDIPAGIQSALEAMARTVAVDRAYLFDYDFEQGIASNTREWCAPGVSSQMANLQGIPLDALAEAVALHRRSRDHYIPDVQALPEGPARALLEGQGIKSLLTVPLMNGDDCLGCVGFDAVREPSTFSGDERALLTVFARLLVNALRRL